MTESAQRVVVMGVSGCGKSTVGQLIALDTGGTFLDGDELHPPSNVAKMASGIPLTDHDREPWLREVGQRLATSEETLVIACSALKRAYRDVIRAAVPNVLFVHLSGSREILAERMAARPGHFMPPSLLDSQLATLEELDDDEQGIVVDVSASPASLAHDAIVWVAGVPRLEGR